MRTVESNKLEHVIIVGDRVLVKPKSLKEQTKSGLYLPPGVQEKEKVQEGYIMKVGPGYPIAADFGLAATRTSRKMSAIFPCRPKPVTWPSTSNAMPLRSFTTRKDILSCPSPRS